MNLEDASQHGLKFVLVRAGSTELDEQGRILGSLDLPLSLCGRQTVCQTADQILRFRVDAIHAAGCQAAQQTAELIGAKLGIKVKVESKMTNLDCGLWHGKSLEELRETQPSLFKQWKEHPEQVCPPHGELLSQVQSRAAAVINKLKRKFKTGTVVMVAPEPLLGVIRAELHPLPVDEKPGSLKCGEWELVEMGHVIVS